jgi:fumarate reductase flavoprotein subunit
MIISEFVADFCDSPQNEINVSTRLVHEFLERETAKINAIIDSNGSENAYKLRARMEDIMMDKVSIFRNEKDLKEAVDELEELYKRSRNISINTKTRGANPELATAYRVQKMLKLALCVALGALQRTESRGAHYREDHPARNDKDWLKRTLSTWKNEADTLPTLDYEDIDIMIMELPPGFRGYGAKNYVDHPNTAKRLAEIEEIKKSMAQADRFALQQALMPFEHLLPEKYRGRNERHWEPLS